MTENSAVTCTRPDDPVDWPHSDVTSGSWNRIDPVPGGRGRGRCGCGPSQYLGCHKQDDLYAAELDGRLVQHR
jgi:cyclohexanecarboxylate-CoA ligase